MVGRLDQSMTGVHGSDTSPVCHPRDIDGSDSPPKVHGDTKGDTVRAWSQGEHTKDRRPLYIDTLPESTEPREGDSECHHEQDEGYRRCRPVIFSLDLIHSEVDALLGPALRWKDPFQVRDHKDSCQNRVKNTYLLVSLEPQR